MRFKKGDRVRYTAGHEEYNDARHKGREGVVSEDDGGVTIAVEWQGDVPRPSTHVFRANIALVEQPKFKVGDKVRVTTERHGESQFGKTGMVVETYRRGDLDIEIEYDEPLGKLTRNQYASRDLELVDWDFDPRKTLKIEAGKFYKTRDGRKVGPTSRRTGKLNWPWIVPQEDVTYADNGIHLAWGAESNNDLIAEWTSCCAAAQVDNLRDEYGPFTKAGAKAEPVAAGNDNSKPKFKVGDFLTKKTGGWRDEGYEVKKIEGGSVYLDDTHGDTAGYDLNDRDFVVVKAAIPTTPAIVCLIENGQPKPSTEPHVHANKEAAGKEATRLARKFPGQEFGVYELVDTRQEAKPTYKYEWQTLAAEGRKIEAIKELRAMTGLGLKATKDAVEHWIANDEPRSRLAA